jgi:putative OPT family oligopeptide transporter
MSNLSASRSAPEPESGAAFQPYVPASQTIPEFTAKAIILGSVFGILFGASTVYLALKAGLTVSASIPIAVLSIAVFKRIGRSTILENNIVQTIGSAGESIASGVVFTVPALLFLAGGPQYFEYLQILTLAAVGGIVGVLFMIPLRRSLIVKEHGHLPYPEGTACAEVLMVGEKGGSLARRVFQGVGHAALYWLLMGVLVLWNRTPGIRSGPKSVYPNATLNCDVTPEYLGVGYIIGPRIAAEMVSGGVLSWLALIPLISLYLPEARLVEDLHKLGFSDSWIATHSVAEQIYRAYIRYIGAGAVACAGVMTLLKTLPTIVQSFRDSIRDLRGGGAGGGQARTEQDIPLPIVVLGALVMVILIAVLPNLPGRFPQSLMLSLLVVVFGFFFVTVASRIVGIIGSSSSPISGMTIATLMGTCLVFVSIGWRGEAYQAVALMVGSVVCIAAANAGATSQDLKTGFLVGATPYKQQLGLIIGVLVSVLVIGGTVLALDRSMISKGVEHAIGSERFPAPQSVLMATMIKGQLSQQLPWGPVLVGVFLAFVAQLAGAHALSWAVGAYLPLSTTAPIFIGGVVKWFISRKKEGAASESDIGPGMLYATGLVAGGSLAGLLIAFLEGFLPELAAKLSLGARLAGLGGGLLDLWSFAMFFVLCLLLGRQALSKDKG